MYFRGIPYLRYLLFFVLGILSFIYLKPFFDDISVYIYLSSLATILFYYFIFYRKIFVTRYLIYPFFYCCGILCTSVKTEKLADIHFFNNTEPYTAYSGVISSEPEEKENTYKFVLKINAIKTKQQWEQKQGKIFLYIFKNGIKSKPKYGEYLVVKGNADTISNPLNPGEFNFKRFYSFQQIHHRDFVGAKDFFVYDYQPENEIVKLSFDIRAWAENLFKTNISTERERKIAAALILGIKGSLDWEIMQAYASTGTMHVLAVSGLHVGIIYQILLLLCFWSKKIRYGNWLKAGFLLFCLWFYALITGLSPSVLRSVSMFTFIIIAEATNRKSNIYNTLSASCLFLLCINPYMLMEVGFLLSYLAVLGIVYIQPRIYQLLEIKNNLQSHPFYPKNKWISVLKIRFLNAFYWVLDWIWMISCVSIAAQIATFPLGILYFHQFPNYFLVSNLAVIPAALGIMYVGLSFVLLSYFDFIAQFAGLVIQFAVQKLNIFILFLEDLPFSVVRGISISILDTWQIYLVLLLFLIFLEKRKLVYFKMLFVLIALISIQLCFKIIERKNQIAFTIYAIHKGFGFDFFDGNSLASYVDSSVLESPSKMQFFMLNNRWKKGVDMYSKRIEIEQKGAFSFFTHQNKTFGLIKTKISYLTFKNKIKIDYLIIQNNAVWSWETVSQLFDYKYLILDGTNKPWYAKNFIKSIPTEKRKDCKYLIESGALEGF